MKTSNHHDNIQYDYQVYSESSKFETWKGLVSAVPEKTVCAKKEFFFADLYLYQRFSHLGKNLNYSSKILCTWSHGTYTMGMANEHQQEYALDAHGVTISMILRL